ncbi:hypothetical protein D9615_010679 [Tricholomella constricta]|uniref:CCHC-type domain-containing protein n=1 Tax=Tricholomella constricta TaxID=117010 RepID=A0A8H5LRJ2_9AGAR|nr:hypothetical protein D9615_010679 [Tricholomella constricta]
MDERWSRRASATPIARETAKALFAPTSGEILKDLLEPITSPFRVRSTRPIGPTPSGDDDRFIYTHYASHKRTKSKAPRASTKFRVAKKLAPRRRTTQRRDAQGRFLAFREPTPALSSTPPTSDTSRSDSPDSYEFQGRSPTAPTSPLRIPTPIPDADDDMPANIEPFWGDRPDENGQDFFRAFNRAMGDKSDNVKRKLFVNYLHADSEADEWYAGLPANVRGDWDQIEQAFHLRWPRATVARKTAMEYEEEILAMQLKEESVGLKETVAGREVYTHIAWADRMGALVARAGHATGSTYIGLVRRGLPTLIRDKIVGTPASWTHFLATVRAVDIDQIRDSAAELRKERERQKKVDDRMRMLEAMASPTRAIRAQLAHTTLAPNATRARQTATTDDNPFLAAGGGQGSLSYAVTTTNAQGGRAGGGTGARMSRPPPTEADRAALRARIAGMVHHPNTEAGRTAHQAQQRAWIEQHGAETKVTELTPYPLRPGTLPPNSNECFGCGMAGHIAPRCPLPMERKLNIREADWRAICRSVLRVAFATPNENPKPTPTQEQGIAVPETAGEEQGNAKGGQPETAKQPPARQVTPLSNVNEEPINRTVARAALEREQGDPQVGEKPVQEHAQDPEMSSEPQSNIMGGQGAPPARQVISDPDGDRTAVDPAAPQYMRTERDRGQPNEGEAPPPRRRTAWAEDEAEEEDEQPATHEHRDEHSNQLPQRHTTHRLTSTGKGIQQIPPAQGLGRKGRGDRRKPRRGGEQDNGAITDSIPGPNGHGEREA